MGTAAVTENSLVGTFDPNIVDGGPGTIIREAHNENPAAQRRLAQTYTFKVRAETSSNNDPVTVVNLNTQGLSWVGADNIRNITTKAWWCNVAGTTFGYDEKVDTVKGSAAGSTPALSVAGEPGSTEASNQKYRVRSMMTTTGTTPVYTTIGVAISSGAVVVRCQGGAAGVDLRWLVEVTVEPLQVLPVAVT